MSAHACWVGSSSSVYISQHWQSILATEDRTTVGDFSVNSGEVELANRILFPYKLSDLTRMQNLATVLTK